MKSKLYLSALLMACTLSLSAEEVITDTTLMTFNMMGAMPYYRVNYTYESVAPDGVTPVTLSSALFFPQRIFERTAMLEIAGKEFNASGLVLNNHFTITKRDEAPTVNSNPLIEGPFATLGPSLIIVSPDSYGFGVTDDKPQAYLIADITAINHIDAVGAARRLLKKMGYSVADLFAQFGYSQGGHSSMAVQRYFDTHEVDPEVISRIDYTLCGDGPYDISAMTDSLLVPGATFPYPCAISLIAEGQIEGANLDISYSDIFHAPLDTKLIEWNDSKALTTDEINDSIFACIGGNPSTGIQVDKMIRTDNISRSNPAMDSYFQAIYDNSVCYDWTPNPDTRFFLYHSADDEVVPYFNMEHMRDFLRDKCGIGDDKLETYTSEGRHVDAALLFVMNVISKIGALEADYIANTTVDIPTIDSTNDIPASNAWFTLDGRRLLDKPTTKGLYIHNGRKVLIK